MRSPRTGGTASSSSPSSTTPVNSPAASPSGQSTPGVTTRVSRRATGIASAIAGHLGLGITSAPSTPSPLAEEVTAPAPSSSTSKTPSRVERKSHALRSVGGTASLVTSPFPGEYGGSEKCGVHEDDEADEVLMAVCGACAVTVRIYCTSLGLVRRPVLPKLTNRIIAHLPPKMSPGSHSKPAGSDLPPLPSSQHHTSTCPSGIISADARKPPHPESPCWGNINSPVRWRNNRSNQPSIHPHLPAVPDPKAQSTISR